MLFGCLMKRDRLPRISLVNPNGITLPVEILPGYPVLLIIVGQGPTALVVGAGGVCLDIFSLIYHFSLLSLSFWEMVRYKRQYCLKGMLNLKQPTNL